MGDGVIADVLRLMAVPAPEAVAKFDAVERRLALYASDRQLTLGMRGDRARLFETAVRGVELVGLLEILRSADEFRALTRHAHLDNCPDARADLTQVWADKRRAKLARTLAQSPAWARPEGEC